MKLKLVTYLCISICVFIQHIKAQTSLKLYLTNQYYYIETSAKDLKSTESQFHSYPGFALAYSKKSYSQEVELARINLKLNSYRESLDNRTTDGSTSAELLVQSRYSFNYTIFQPSENKVNFSLGLGTAPLFRSKTIDPRIRTFHTSHTIFNIPLEILPRLKMKLTNHISGELLAPVQLLSLNNTWSRVENPTIPIRQQKNSNTTIDYLPLIFELNFGIAFML